MSIRLARLQCTASAAQAEVASERNITLALATEIASAVGVGVAPGGHLDEQCATAALDTVKAQLK
ncbi:hypothetical protein D9M68_940090 [compost metagenome]